MILRPSTVPHRGFAMSAFSLIEVMAILAIIAALAAILLPNYIKRMDEAARVREINALASIRDALEADARRMFTLPGVTTWTQAVARCSDFPASWAAVNPRGYHRVFYTEEYPNPALAPNSQTYAGATLPGNLRAMVISTLGGSPLNIGNCPEPDGGTLAQTAFNDLWNTPDGTRPNHGAWLSWDGRPDEFLIQRVNFAPLFHRLVLVNRDPTAASFTINGSSPVQLVRSSPNTGLDSWYMDGTVVGLGDGSGTVLVRHVLSGDISFVYEGGSWRGDIVGMHTGNSAADDFGVQAAAFLRSQWNDDAQKGADQVSVLTAMYSFMYTYTLWANQCPHFPQHGATAVQVPEYLLLQKLGDPNQRLDVFCSGLVK